MTEEQADAISQSEALSLLAFLLSSAEGCLKEPAFYGVYRLSTAAIQLAEAWAPRASPETAAFLRELVSRWAHEASLLSHDPQVLKSYLADSGTAIAAEIKRQADQRPAL